MTWPREGAHDKHCGAHIAPKTEPFSRHAHTHFIHQRFAF
jgi:hypothetical protein